MKQGWEIMPFEDSIVKVKYTTKIPSNDYLEQGLYPIVSQEEGLISGYWDNANDVFKVSSPVVIFGDHTRILKYVDFDFVLGADGVKILQPIKGLDAKFFKLYLESCKIPSLGYSRHYKLLKELQVPIPPREEQERIVAELDCLSGVIEKKREQLKELDALAQSIFYQMFGDPITNEKRWQVKKLGEVCISDLGKTLDSKKNKGDLYNYLCSINVQWGYFDLKMLKEMRLEEYELERYSVKKGDLLICEGGDTGRCAIWNSEEPMYFQNALHRVRFTSNTILPIFCQYVMSYMKKNGEIDKYSKGQTIKHLVKSALMSIPIIIPPLALQQEFSEKIDLIEKQKQLLKESIIQIEELFNSRMNYYFN